ncbi:MAG: hypothetical protein EBU30_02130 [Synechococcaceae bacterium WB6_3B_236]|nr:hypothetical protein [Synechococcaceae bacterium WB6_3B_236]
MRLAIAALLPPGYDEAYYLFYGHHLALSYFDHPAAVGLWAWLGLHLPFSSFGLRLPGVLSYTLASALLALASQRQLGRSAGLWTAALTGLSPLLLACGGVLLLPDAPLLLLLSAVIYALAVDAPWGLLGLLLGGLTLCKYQALPLLGCLLIWALSHPQRRRRLFGAEGIKALAAWALVSSPLWIWNAQNGWISFLFHGARTSEALGFNPSGPPLFLLTQPGWGQSLPAAAALASPAAIAVVSAASGAHAGAGELVGAGLVAVAALGGRTAGGSPGQGSPLATCLELVQHWPTANAFPTGR